MLGTKTKVAMLPLALLALFISGGLAWEAPVPSVGAVTGRVFWQTRTDLLKRDTGTIQISSAKVDGTDVQHHFQLSGVAGGTAPFGVDRSGNVYFALYDQASSHIDVVRFDLKGTRKGVVSSNVGDLRNIQVRNGYILQLICDNSGDELAGDIQLRDSCTSVSVVSAPTNSSAAKRIFLVRSNYLSLPNAVDICHSVESCKTWDNAIGVSGRGPQGNGVVVIGSMPSGSIDGVFSLPPTQSGGGVSVHNNEVYYTFFEDKNFSGGQSYLAKSSFLN
ncbi:hypothetical protein QOT17_004817 [Balamuthia mandrillaris]